MTPRDRKIGVLAALSWVLAVAVTGAVAERAVAVLDASSTRTGVLSQAEVAGALAAARAGASPTGTATPTPPVSPTVSASAPTQPTGGSSTAGSSTAPATASPPVAPSTHPAARPTTSPPTPEVARTWTVTGGTVAASCRDAVIALLYATPQDGWTVDVRSAGPDRIEVELKMADQETTVTAVCVGGVPQQTVAGPTHDAAPGSGGTDD